MGNTTNACTKGIWVWNQPIKGQTADGENVNIIVIDSEGIGALDENADHDNRIFSLVILLSSCFIYNSLGSIDETAIDNLHLIVNITKNIQVSAGDNEETSVEDYAQYFPNFLWVVRDFSLQLVDEEGDQISSKEYLDKALKEQEGFSDAVMDKNRVRKLIRAFFSDRDCYTMSRPLIEEEKLQKLETLEVSELRPEFVEQMLQLR